MDPQIIEQLVKTALAARSNAYAPYSKFLVGAAVRTSDGNILSGANVENTSLGLTLCAERVAAVTAISAVHRQLTAVAVAPAGGVLPCGACRQFLAEFGADMHVILVDADQSVQVANYLLGDLLPDPFERGKPED